MEKRSHLVSGIVLVAAAALLAAGCGGERQTAHAPGPPEVSTVTLATEPVTLTTELPGRTAPYLVAEIRPQVSGIITRRPFTEGADVKAGDLLYQIDPAPFQAAYDQAAAALEVAQAKVPALRSRAQRFEELADIEAVGKQDAEDAESALRQAEAAVTAAKAALESARVNLSFTPIKAPISGRIGRSAVTMGALVTAYQPTSLAVIQKLDPIYVDVTQATSDLLRLKRAAGTGRITDGDGSRSVSLILEDGTPYPLEGKLQFRDVSVDPSTGSVTLRMVFPNPDHVLLPGMFVRAVVEEGVMQNAVLAPQQGVSHDVRGDAVAWVVGPDGKVEQRHLEVDRAIGDRWLVTSGLAAGDQVIVEGLQNVRPGMTVKAVPFQESGADQGSARPPAPAAPAS